MDIKTVDVYAKEWLDRVNGNSYFSCHVTLKFSMPDEKTVVMPFQYGYGDHYRDMAFQELQKRGYIPEQGEYKAHWVYYAEHNIIARHYKQEKCLKRDVIAFGKVE